MAYTCELKELPAQPTLAVRTRAAVQDLPRLFGQTYGRVIQYLMTLDEAPANASYAAYYNTDMQDLDIEIGFPVNRALPGTEDIQAGFIPAGKYAAVMHVGTYDKIEPAYGALMQWVKEKGFETTGVSYELYLDDPSKTPPEELRTQVLFPLKT